MMAIRLKKPAPKAGASEATAKAKATARAKAAAKADPVDAAAFPHLAALLTKLARRHHHHASLFTSTVHREYLPQSPERSTQASLYTPHASE